MPERIRFPLSEEQREREIFEVLKKERGILYSEEFDPETKEKKSYVNILGVKLETYASKEEIDEIKKEIVLSKLDQEMLRTIAECYKLKQPLMLEGDPGVGKSYLMEQFVRLIHGKEAPILKLTGTPRTTEFEILGHWAPAAHQRESKDPKVLEALRRYDEIESKYREITSDFDKKYEQIIKDLENKKITKEDADSKIEELIKWFRPLEERYTREFQILVQRTTLTKTVEWEFKKGPLLEAYSGREGKGYILIVDEFNLIPSNYQQIFLQIGGKEGALSDSISHWGDTGEVIHRRGKDTWICFASNYPEKTPGRNEVVGPMTDRLVWKTITPEEAEKKKEVLRKTGGGRLKKRLKKITSLSKEIISIPVEKGIEWDKVLDEELGEQIADIVDLLDGGFEKYYQEVGDKINGERIQKIEFSGRNSLRLYSYHDHFQVRNPETGFIDFRVTLYNAFKRYYLDRLVNPEARGRMIELFNKILGLDITAEELKTLNESEKILKGGGKELPVGAVLFQGKVRTRKEVLDILAEVASLTKEQIAELQAEEQERKRREEEKIRFDIKDKIKELLNNPNIPQSLKDLLGE